VVTNVTVAERPAAAVFSCATNVTEPLPEPVAGPTVNQVALEVALQVVLAVTDTAATEDEADGIVQLTALSVNDGAVLTPGCVTVTVCVTDGLPLVVVKVSVAVRAAAAVLV